jgi:hypothetical protein
MLFYSANLFVILNFNFYFVSSLFLPSPYLLGTPTNGKMGAQATYRRHVDVVEDVAWHPLHESLFGSVGDDKLFMLYALGEMFLCVILFLFYCLFFSYVSLFCFLHSLID